MIPLTDNSLKWSTVLGPWKMQWWGCSSWLIWVSNVWVEISDTCCCASSLTFFCRRWIWCWRIAICSEELSEVLVTLMDVSPPSQIVSIPKYTSALLFPDACFRCLEIVHWLHGITTVWRQMMMDNAVELHPSCEKTWLFLHQVHLTEPPCKVAWEVFLNLLPFPSWNVSNAGIC